MSDPDSYSSSQSDEEFFSASETQYDTDGSASGTYNSSFENRRAPPGSSPSLLPPAFFRGFVESVDMYSSLAVRALSRMVLEQAAEEHETLFHPMWHPSFCRSMDMDWDPYPHDSRQPYFSGDQSEGHVTAPASRSVASSKPASASSMMEKEFTVHRLDRDTPRAKTPDIPAHSQENVDVDDESLFPNGTCTLIIPLSDGDIDKLQDRHSSVSAPMNGWAWATYSSYKVQSGQRKILKYCLGVYTCPFCEFVERPCSPSKKKSKYALPNAPKHRCRNHPDAPLKHHSCECLMTCVLCEHPVGTDNGPQWRIEFTGEHQHARPPLCARHVPQSARNAFAKIVQAAPELTPTQLKLGSRTRPPVSMISPALHNRHIVAFLKKQALAPSRVPSSWLGLTAHLHRLEANGLSGASRFIRHMQSDPGKVGFVLMTEEMERLVQSLGGPYQTDTVHDFVLDFDFPSTLHLTVSSIFDFELAKHVPVLFTLSESLSAGLYKLHFDSLFSAIVDFEKDMDCWTWSKFVDAFVGNTSDMSDAELNGFERAMRHLKQDVFLSKEPFDKERESLYRFCEVHFLRSVARVSRISAIVDPGQQEQFKREIVSLLRFEKDQFDAFHKSCEELLGTYPRAAAWLKWYLVPRRATILFPACKSISDAELKRFDRLSKDTNAQENVGRQIQSLALPSKPMQLGDAVDYLLRFVENQRIERTAVRSGQALSYGALKPPDKKKRKRKSPTKNDGRAPDTPKKLLPNKRSRTEKPLASFKRQSSRGGAATATLPSTALQFFGGIPFGTQSHPYVTNTCRLDTFLTCLYYLHENRVLARPMKDLRSSNSIMSRVFILMKRRRYDEARLTFLDNVTVQGYTPGSRCSIFGEFEELLDISRTEFKWNVNWERVCLNDRCRHHVTPEHPTRVEDWFGSIQITTSKTEICWTRANLQSALAGRLAPEDSVVTGVCGRHARVIEAPDIDDCKGPSQDINHSLEFLPHFAVFVGMPDGRVSLVDMPTQIKFQHHGSPFTLVLRFAVLLRPEHHYTGALWHPGRTDGEWIGYDGLSSLDNKLNPFHHAEDAMDDATGRRYAISHLVYEIVRDIQTGQIAAREWRTYDETIKEAVNAPSSLKISPPKAGGEMTDSAIRQTRRESNRQTIHTKLKKLSLKAKMPQKAEKSKNRHSNKPISKFVYSNMRQTSKQRLRRERCSGCNLHLESREERLVHTFEDGRGNKRNPIRNVYHCRFECIAKMEDPHRQ